jgi:hypothetical protein
LLAVVRHAAIACTWVRAAECAAKMHPTSTNYIHEIRSSRESPPC